MVAFTCLLLVWLFDLLFLSRLLVLMFGCGREVSVPPQFRVFCLSFGTHLPFLRSAHVCAPISFLHCLYLAWMAICSVGHGCVSALFQFLIVIFGTELVLPPHILKCHIHISSYSTRNDTRIRVHTSTRMQMHCLSVLSINHVHSVSSVLSCFLFSVVFAVGVGTVGAVNKRESKVNN